MIDNPMARRQNSSSHEAFSEPVELPEDRGPIRGEQIFMGLGSGREFWPFLSLEDQNDLHQVHPEVFGHDSQMPEEETFNA